MDSEEEKHGDSLDNLPPGYRFEPNPQELIVHYLIPKITGIALPVNPIHKIDNIYGHSPEDVTARFNAQGEKGKHKVWYFMTSRNKKYMNGRRPNRQTGDGYWKVTGQDKEVMGDDNKMIGHQRSLVYHRGIPSRNQKTQWQMLEIRLPDKPKSLLNKRKRDQQQDTSMKLDYVICRIYYKEREVGKREVQVPDAEEAAAVVTETEEANTTTTTTHNNQMMMPSEVINNTYIPAIGNTNRSGAAYIPGITNINCSDVCIPEITNTNTSSNSNYLAAFGGQLFNNQFCNNNNNNSNNNNNNNNLVMEADNINNGYGSELGVKSNEYDVVNGGPDYNHSNDDDTLLMPPPLPLDVSRPDYLSGIPGSDPGLFSEPPSPDFFSDLVFPLSTHM